MNIQKAIAEECLKLIQRHQALVAQNNAQRRKFERITGEPGGRHQHRFSIWDVADHFNPYKVRKKARRAAASIQHRLDTNTYEPRPVLVREVDKADGSKRALSIFPVADAGLGTLVFRRINDRNQHRLSPFSYAFRSDIRIHQAIDALSRELTERNRYWVVEFDFAKYFDTISHDYILKTVAKYFRVTENEYRVLRATLGSNRAFGVERYRAGKYSATTKGVPQGNSLSLFLANAACHELDLAIGRTAATFARYADDILLLCRTSAEADHVAELILDHCKTAGLAVNFSKSDAISQFGPEWVSERRRETHSGGKHALDYLGYRFEYRQIRRSPPVSGKLSPPPRSGVRASHSLGA